jgi:hypothetical protein
MPPSFAATGDFFSSILQPRIAPRIMHAENGETRKIKKPEKDLMNITQNVYCSSPMNSFVHLLSRNIQCWKKGTITQNTQTRFILANTVSMFLPGAT